MFQWNTYKDGDRTHHHLDYLSLSRTNIPLLIRAKVSNFVINNVHTRSLCWPGNHALHICACQSLASCRRHLSRGLSLPKYTITRGEWTRCFHVFSILNNKWMQQTNITPRSVAVPCPFSANITAYLSSAHGTFIHFMLTLIWLRQTASCFCESPQGMCLPYSHTYRSDTFLLSPNIATNL